MIVAFGVAINLRSAERHYFITSTKGREYGRQTDRNPIVSWPEVSTDAFRCRASVTETGDFLFAFDLLSMSNIGLVVVF